MQPQFPETGWSYEGQLLLLLLAAALVLAFGAYAFYRIQRRLRRRAARRRSRNRQAGDQATPRTLES